jgi:hypothetical protein
VYETPSCDLIIGSLVILVGCHVGELLGYRQTRGTDRAESFHPQAFVTALENDGFQLTDENLTVLPGVRLPKSRYSPTAWLASQIETSVMEIRRLYCTATSQIAQGSNMTTATYTNSSAGSLRHYLKDVSTAARAFAEALFAAQSRQFVAQEVRASQAVSERAKAKGRRQLLSLANQSDLLSPSLSAELRSIAARD